MFADTGKHLDGMRRDERGWLVDERTVIQTDGMPQKRIVSKMELARRYGVPQVQGAQKRYYHVTTISIG